MTDAFSNRLVKLEFEREKIEKRYIQAQENYKKCDAANQRDLLRYDGYPPELKRSNQALQQAISEMLTMDRERKKIDKQIAELKS